MVVIPVMLFPASRAILRLIGTVRFVSPVHPLRQLVPMNETDVGMTSVLRLVNPANIPASTAVTPSSNITVTSTAGSVKFQAK